MDDTREFVERFDRAWRAGREGLRDFEALVAPDVTLTQPMLPVSHGLEGFRAQFDAIFDAVPDLRGEVMAWGATDDGVLIDLALRGTVAGKPVELVTCDRVVIRDGLMVARHARMDPLPLVRAALRSPRVARRMLRPRASRPASPAPSSGARPAPHVSSASGSHSAPTASSASGPRTAPLASPGLTALAVGRLVLGSLGRAAPGATVRSFGGAASASPELDYLTRVFGARAIALGSGYLLSGGDARRLWQRIALGVDISDTIAGIGHLRRGDVPRASALALTALTGCYTAVGAASLIRDLTQ
jgi:SnoaL-like protein